MHKIFRYSFLSCFFFFFGRQLSLKLPVCRLLLLAQTFYSRKKNNEQLRNIINVAMIFWTQNMIKYAYEIKWFQKTNTKKSSIKHYRHAFCVMYKMPICSVLLLFGMFSFFIAVVVVVVVCFIWSRWLLLLLYKRCFVATLKVWSNSGPSRYNILFSWENRRKRQTKYTKSIHDVVWCGVVRPKVAQRQWRDSGEHFSQTCIKSMTLK